jgi:dihydroxyacetone kinase-like predicted kinase
MHFFDTYIFPNRTGVVDSGAAGFAFVIQGMAFACEGTINAVSSAASIGRRGDV